MLYFRHNQKISSELDNEIIINKIRQGIISKEEAKEWFLTLPSDQQLALLKRTAYITLQAGVRDDDIPIAIEKSHLRPTYTPCILLKRGRVKEQIAKILTLPASEYLKSFILLVTLFEIADTRRYNTHCINGCTHWWHRDLSNQRVLDEIQEKHRNGVL